MASSRHGAPVAPFIALLVLASYVIPSASAFLAPSGLLPFPSANLGGARSRSSDPAVGSAPPQRNYFVNSLTASSLDNLNLSRRRAALSFLAFVPVLLPQSAIAASDVEGGKGEEAAESIRKMASKLPGMGPPDVAYPEEMTGRWAVQKTLAGVDFPAGRSAADPGTAEKELARVGQVSSFNMRFVRIGDIVVADREFNARQEIAAQEGKDVNVLWKATNPNVLTVTYPTGEVVERKVTKRSATADATTMEFSEYSRIATLSSGASLMGRGGGPEITARWVRGKLKLTGAGQAEGIMLDYVLPPQKPDPSAAVMKLKYRLKLQRQP